jgi:hypothetical protein
MSTFRAIAACAAFFCCSAAFGAGNDCPKREAGQAYPWQNLEPVPGDQEAWVYIDVDKTGRPLRCQMGPNNIPDPETRFRVCQAFTGDWRAPPATATDPGVRTIKRHFTMIGYNHQMADQKVRKLWFKAHPEERPACYPE